MTQQPQVSMLEQMFRFRPIPIWDPIPDWIIVRLPQEALFRLAVTQLEIQKTILEGQIKLVDQAIEISRRMAEQR